MTSTTKIAICTGEASGDEHAAALCQALYKLSPSLEIRGMGGSHLRKAGVTTDVDSEHSASVMGFHDVVLSLHKIFSAYGAMKRLLREWRPDLLIVIDYPDFNLRLARYAKSLGIRVLYYITPQVWAWREGRVRSIANSVDYCSSIFPFEARFYKDRGFNNAVYVGHPFADLVDKCSWFKSRRTSFLSAQSLNAQQPVVALFPGSRNSEIAKHLPVMLAGIEQLRRTHPNIQAIISAARSLPDELFSPYLNKDGWLKLFKGDPLEILCSSDAGILKSGTSNLQAAFAGLPFVMLYKVPLSTELIVRAFVSVKEYSIVNVLKPGTVPELLQRETGPARIAGEMESLLFDNARRERICGSLAQVTSSLASFDRLPLFDGCNNTAERTARLALAIAAGQIPTATAWPKLQAQAAGL